MCNCISPCGMHGMIAMNIFVLVVMRICPIHVPVSLHACLCIAMTMFLFWFLFCVNKSVLIVAMTMLISRSS